MTERIDIHKAGGVIIRKRQFLVTRAHGNDIFVAPGGKLEPGESTIDALLRELVEEVQVSAIEHDLEHLGTFTAQAAGNETKIVKMEVFLVNNTQGEPIPSNEVEEFKWVNTQTRGVKMGSIFEHEVMPLLKQRGLID